WGQVRPLQIAWRHLEMLAGLLKEKSPYATYQLVLLF
ncbi:MAG: hypothetical protein ACJA0M_002223, partial [Chitinophagales bacterium]